ncbi:hypothetical protein PM082_004836 [Marasmius tenuissimus]|nr:hypothetical protein PM082_004836 [Marasmius tenuissimus]
MNIHVLYIHESLQGHIGLPFPNQTEEVHDATVWSTSASKSFVLYAFNPNSMRWVLSDGSLPETYAEFFTRKVDEVNPRFWRAKNNLSQRSTLVSRSMREIPGEILVFAD